jgi:proline dehydrogenase
MDRWAKDMLRRILFYLSAAGWAKALVSRFFLARRVALRFVAGETMDAALAAARALNAQGLLVTLDYLGESVTSPDEATAVAGTYQTLLARIADEGLRASVSLKLTHLGLDIGEDLCVTNLRHILTAARAGGDIPVTIDMEGSRYTDVTLRIYRTMRDEYGFDHVGTVIQANLRRSDADMAALAAEGAHIRLVKGAYFEPPAIAYPVKADVDAAFVRLMGGYFDAIAAHRADGAGVGRAPYLCVATHDERMIAAADAGVKAGAIARAHYEYQMLYGIRSARQLELAGAGEVVRVYVPYGEAWYPYFMRRLAERPANLWFFAKSLFAR